MTAKSVCKNLISDENDPPIDGRNAHSGVLAPDLLRLSDHGISRGLSHNLLNAPLPENITTNQSPLAKAAVQVRISTMIMACIPSKRYSSQYDAACQFSSPPHQETNAMPQNVSLRVPVEVWLRIFRYATVTSQHSLVQAVATCSDLHGPAEEALYTFPTIFNKWTANRFHSTVAESPHRARMVRGLRLACSPKQADDCIATLKETFPLLIRLETIELAFSGKEECLPRPTATSLIKGTSSNLHSLRRIRGLPLYASRHLIRCLSKYPHLEELHLYQYSPLIEDDQDGDDDDDEDVDDDEDGDVDDDDDDSDDDDDYEDSERPEECMLGVLKKLRVLSCPRTMVSRLKSPGTITSLCITDAKSDAMDDVATLFGHQLVSLRLHRELGNYSGMAYPTNWFKREKLPLLKFLDIQDRGRRVRLHPLVLAIPQCSPNSYSSNDTGA